MLCLSASSKSGIVEKVSDDKATFKKAEDSEAAGRPKEVAKEKKSHSPAGRETYALDVSTLRSWEAGGVNNSGEGGVSSDSKKTKLLTASLNRKSATRNKRRLWRHC